MPGVVRAIVDMCTGTCAHPKSSGHPFTGIIITGSTLTKSDALAVGRHMDTVQTSCSDNSTGFVLTCSVLTKDLGLGLARNGDIVQTTYGTMQFIMGSILTNSD